jgi:hypothetical protein
MVTVAAQAPHDRVSRLEGPVGQRVKPLLSAQKGLFEADDATLGPGRLLAFALRGEPQFDGVLPRA